MFILASLLLSSAVPGVTQSQTGLKSEIAKLEANYSKAVLRGDAPAVVAAYADDAILLPDGAPQMKGSGAITAFWQKGVQEIQALDLQTDSVDRLGRDNVQEIGHFILQPKGAGAPKIAGKYLVIWRRTGQTWKITADIMNTDAH